MSRIPWDEDLTPRNFAGFVSGAQTRPPRSSVPGNQDVPEGVADIATRVTGELIHLIQSRVNDSPLRRALMVIMSADEYSNDEFEDMVTAILIIINYRIENEKTSVATIIDDEVEFGCKAFAAMMMEHPDIGKEIQEYIDDDVYRNAREAMRQFNNDLHKARDNGRRSSRRDERDDRDRPRNGSRGRDDRDDRDRGGRNGRRRGRDDRDDGRNEDDRPFDRYGAGRGQPRSERRQEEPQRPAGARASAARRQAPPPEPVQVTRPAPKAPTVDQLESAMSNAFRDLAAKVKGNNPGIMVLSAQQESYQDYLAAGTSPIVYDYIRSASFFATSDRTKPWVSVIVPKDPSMKYEDHANEHLLRSRDTGFRAARRTTYQPTAAQLAEASRSKKIEELLSEFRDASAVADGKDVDFTIDSLVQVENPIGDLEPLNARALIVAAVAADVDSMNIDVDRVPVGATVVAVTPWHVNTAIADTVAACINVDDIDKLVDKLSSVRAVMPGYFWEWLNGQLTELFNESLVTMMGYPAVGDDNCLAIMSFFDNAVAAIKIVLDERGPRHTESFVYCFLKMLQGSLLRIDNADLLVTNSIAGISDDGMYFVTVSDHVLLPLSSADLALACAGSAGVLTQEALPELYALVKARMAAKHKQARRLTFETNEGLLFHVWPDLLNKERFILSGVKTFSPS